MKIATINAEISLSAFRQKILEIAECLADKAKEAEEGIHFNAMLNSDGEVTIETSYGDHNSIDGLLDLGSPMVLCAVENGSPLGGVDYGIVHDSENLYYIVKGYLWWHGCGNRFEWDYKVPENYSE